MSFMNFQISFSLPYLKSISSKTYIVISKNVSFLFQLNQSPLLNFVFVLSLHVINLEFLENLIPKDRFFANVDFFKLQKKKKRKRKQKSGPHLLRLSKPSTNNVKSKVTDLLSLLHRALTRMLKFRYAYKYSKNRKLIPLPFYIQMYYIQKNHLLPIVELLPFAGKTEP